MKESLNTLLIGRTESLHAQFLRFLAAGGVVVVIDMAVFYLLSVSFGINYLIANTLSFIVAMSIEYFISREWVFNRVQHQLTRDYLLFLFCSVLCLGIGNGALYVLIDNDWISTVVPGLGRGQELLAAKAVSILFITLFDFWFKRRFVFGAP